MREYKNIQVLNSETAEAISSFPAFIDLKDVIHPASKDSHFQVRDQYAGLKRIMRQKGLLDQQPVYYTLRILLTLSLLAVGIVFLLMSNHFWLQLLDAVYLGFVFTQIAGLSHDIGHRQVFRSNWRANVTNLIAANLLLGLSGAWWVDRHNQHHSHPNQFDLDPDIAIPFISFSVEEARNKPQFLRFIVKYQAYFFFPTQVFVIPGFTILSIRFLLAKKARYPLAEAFLILLHYVLYVGLLLTRLNIWQAIVFLVVQQACCGLYLGSVFAPNHKGMPILDKETRLDFLHRQVLTSRNIQAHPLIDFWYFGLNYQIEHHLFPTMPRNRLREAQHIVKAFCQSRDIPYYETGPLQSYKEILCALHEASAPLRSKA